MSVALAVQHLPVAASSSAANDLRVNLVHGFTQNGACLHGFGSLLAERVDGALVTLIDALYEAKTRLICSAAAEPDDLYEEGPGAFEFQRTASRLTEMRSGDW